MKKLFLFIAVVMLAIVTVNAQQTLPASDFSKQTTTVSKVTSTQAETQITTPRKCGTMENLELMMQQDPTLEAKMQAEEKKFNEYIAEHQQELENNKTVYIMPVVVHVIYANSSQNISDARVNEQITQTNSDWAGTNGRSMEAFSTSLRADCQITLCLATKDESGNPTTGIERRQTTASGFGYGTGMKYYSSGGLDAWDPTKYLNIWVCNLTGGLCGFAQFPTSGINATYGVVIHYQFFGITGASAPYNLGGTTSHEFGHCFNLYHIWGDQSGCSPDDGYADTPTQNIETYGNHSGVLTDVCQGSSPGIMYMNFMDYSDDIDYANMTPNQKTVMQAAVATYLTSVANNAATACSIGPIAPVANFSASATTVPEGTTVNFTDLSTNSPTSWSWTFAGGTPGSSINQSPSIVYNTAGTYSVTLTATNAIGSDSETKTNYITVTSGAVQTCDTLHYQLTGTPALYGFSALGYVSGNNSYGDLAKADYFGSYAPYTTLYGAYFWFVRAKDGGPTTDITFNVWNNGGTGGAPGTVIGSATVPLSTIVSNVNSSLMTGVSFTTPITITGPFYVGVVLPTASACAAGDTLALVTNSDEDTSPGTAWEQWSDNVWYNYNTSWDMDGAGNMLNCQTGIFPIVCTNPVGIPENASLESILIYPNPANDVLNINMANYGKADIKVEIYNAMGELVKSMNNNSQTLQIDMSNEVSGIYYVTLTTSEGTLTRKVSLIK
ncbi:MAG: M43 family zinc metalloprotease [Bacteroidota bacterium]